MSDHITSDQAILAGVAAKLDMHLMQDSKTFDRIEGALVRIADGQSAMNEKLDRTVARIHDRIEEETGKAIKEARDGSAIATAAAEQIGKEARADVEDLQKQVIGAHSRISKQTIKFYGLAVVAIVAVLGWIVEVTGFGRTTQQPPQEHTGKIG